MFDGCPLAISTLTSGVGGHCFKALPGLAGLGSGCPGRQHAGLGIDVRDVRLDLDVGDLDGDRDLHAFGPPSCAS